MLSGLRQSVRRRPALALTLIAVLVLAGLTTAVSLAAPPGEPISQIEQELVDAVNAEREKIGLHPLTVNYSLMEAAYKHTDHMANIRQICHNGCGDGTVAERIQATGYKYITFGENVAFGQPNVAAVMNAWMNSPGHRRNILSPDYTDIGVGHVARGGHYWTQVFGTPIPPPDYATVTPPAGHGRPCELVGDFDFDGQITSDDLNTISSHFMDRDGAPGWDPQFDLVPDGVVNVYDIYEVARSMGKTCG